MLKALLLLPLFFSISSPAQFYKTLHEKAIVIDAHNDVLINILNGLDITTDLTGKTHSDVARFKRGGVDVQIFSVWSDERYEKGKGFAYANRQIDSLYSITNRNADRMMIVRSPKDFAHAVKQKKLGVMMGLEGGHMIEDSIQYLERLYQRGVRYMTLTWNNSTSWASSAADEAPFSSPGGGKSNSQPLPVADSAHNEKSFKGAMGLTELGKKIVRRMNELGMLVDLSHVGEKTFWDVMDVVTKPVIVSHSCVYALCPNRRNLRDEQIKAVANNGGVIHVNFYSGFLDSNFGKRKMLFENEHRNEIDSLKKNNLPDFEIDMWLAKHYPAEAEKLRAPLSLLIDHIDYIVKLAGIDHVGLGSDFDGIDSAPQQMDDVGKMPLITKALLERGYRKKDIEKILGGNFIRIFKEAQRNK